jgi:YesN/AraC family two-component response regulator
VKSFQTHPCPKACWLSSKQTLALGYSTPSNFIAMFRKIYGESPARYFSRCRAE